MNSPHVLKTVGLVALTALLLCLALTGACALYSSLATEDPERGVSEGGLDRILLSEKSYEAGPFLFDHKAHYAAHEAGGASIPCSVCHHTWEGSPAEPPVACSHCHRAHSDPEQNDLPSL